ncbi:MAG: cell division protein FtsZ, partial [Flavobacteriaceae bacterium]|nr:cell division protein FtsZ [Flavobacteriaceae bacterium]
MSTEFEGISFDLPKNQSNVIKVIGVGGGGSNAINHMFQSGINGVDFVVCNTDSQALENSPVPNKIQLGISLTEGLGAGANPEVGEKAAIESQEEVKAMLETNTKMVFITAGMGGGTGTGAAPIIAKHAKDLDILTVGIVTTPFVFEGKMRSDQAQLGIEKLRANVDSLIIINNNKLREVYGNLGFKAGFSKADEVLATAAKGIAEVITHHYTQNIDLRDAKTVLANSGTAIMGSAKASGEGRAQIAIDGALDSPLLNDNKITGAQNVLLLIVSGTCEITIDEIGEINDHIQSQAGHSANIIMGVGEDDSLGEAISVTVIATGFNAEQQNEIVNTETKKIIHTLEDDQKAAVDLSDKNYLSFEAVKDIECEVEEVRSEVEDTSVVRHTLEFEEEVNTASENELIPTSDLIRN